MDVPPQVDRRRSTRTPARARHRCGARRRGAGRASACSRSAAVEPGSLWRRMVDDRSSSGSVERRACAAAAGSSERCALIAVAEARVSGARPRLPVRRRRVRSDRGIRRPPVPSGRAPLAPRAQPARGAHRRPARSRRPGARSSKRSSPATAAAAMSVYLQVTRGAELARDHALSRQSGADRVRLLLRLEPARPRRWLKNGVAVVTQPGRALGALRHQSRSTSPPMSSPRQAAIDAGASEALLRARTDTRSRAARAASMIVEGSGVVTPPDGPHILPGTTRNLLRGSRPQIELSVARGAGHRRAPAGRGRGLDREHDARSAGGHAPGWARSIGTGRPGPLWQRMRGCSSGARRRLRRRCGERRCRHRAVSGRAAAQDHRAGGTRPARARARADRAACDRSRPRACASRSSGGARYLSLTSDRAGGESRGAGSAVRQRCAPATTLVLGALTGQVTVPWRSMR